MSIVTMSVDDVMEWAFPANGSRDPRSREYVEGFRAYVLYKMHGQRIKCPHRIGTCQADAFFAGTDEARSRWQSIP